MKLRSFGRLIIPIFILSISMLSALAETHPSHQSKGMDRLEEITQKAKTLHEFLNDPQLLDEYYVASTQYYGQRINRSDYDQVMKQLKVLDQKIPNLNERLWGAQKSEAKLLLPFDIVASAKSSGRDLNSSALNSYLKKLQDSNEQSAQHAFKPELTEPQQLEELEKFSKDLADRIQKFDRSLDLSQPQKILGQQKSEFFNELREMPKVKALGSFYANKLMHSEAFQDAIRTQDADYILEFLNSQLKNQSELRALLQTLPENTHGIILDQVEKALPTFKGETLNSVFPAIQAISSKGNLYPIGSGATKYEIKAYPKLFHRTLAGIALGECNRTDPLRYLAPAADASSVSYYVQKTGSYLGFTDFIPGKIGNETWVNPQWGASELKKTVTIKGSNQSEPLWRIFLDEIHERKPETWKGFTVSKSSAADNAGVFAVQRNDLRYRLGRETSEPFEMHDPIIEKIRSIRASENFSIGRDYDPKKGMIVDAALNPQKNFVYNKGDLTEEQIVKSANELIGRESIPDQLLGVSILTQNELDHKRPIDPNLIQKIRELNQTSADGAINRYLAKYFNDTYGNNIHQSLITLSSPANADHKIFNLFYLKNDTPESHKWREVTRSVVETAVEEPAPELFERYMSDQFLSRAENELTKPEAIARRTQILNHPSTLADRRIRSALVSNSEFLAKHHRTFMLDLLNDANDVDYTRFIDHFKVHLLDSESGVFSHDNYESILQNSKHPLHESLLLQPKYLGKNQDLLLDVFKTADEKQVKKIVESGGLRLLLESASATDELLMPILGDSKHSAYTLAVNAVKAQTNTGRTRTVSLVKALKTNSKLVDDIWPVLRDEISTDVIHFHVQSTHKIPNQVTTLEKILDDPKYPARNWYLNDYANKASSGRNIHLTEKILAQLENPIEPHSYYLIQYLDKFSQNNHSFTHDGLLKKLDELFHKPGFAHQDAIIDHVRLKLANDFIPDYQKINQYRWNEVLAKHISNTIEKNAAHSEAQIADEVSRELSNILRRLDSDLRPFFHTTRTLDQARLVLDALYRATQDRKELMAAVYARLERDFARLADPLVFNSKVLMKQVISGQKAIFGNPLEALLMKQIAKESCAPIRLTNPPQDQIETIKNCQTLLSKAEKFGWHAEAPTKSASSNCFRNLFRFLTQKIKR